MDNKQVALELTKIALEFFKPKKLDTEPQHEKVVETYKKILEKLESNQKQDDN